MKTRLEGREKLLSSTSTKAALPARSGRRMRNSAGRIPMAGCQRSSPTKSGLQTIKLNRAGAPLTSTRPSTQSSSCSTTVSCTTWVVACPNHRQMCNNKMASIRSWSPEGSLARDNSCWHDANRSLAPNSRSRSSARVNWVYENGNNCRLRTICASTACWLSLSATYGRSLPSSSRIHISNGGLSSSGANSPSWESADSARML
ncbi:hypothetical protein D9M68_448950 [compost metagenome]